MKARMILVLTALLLLPVFIFANEELTITTYYPSPYGSYIHLETNELAYKTPVSTPTCNTADDEGKTYYDRSSAATGHQLNVCTSRGCSSGYCWQPVGGGAVNVGYTYYCYNSAYEGQPVCPSTPYTVGAQGPCDPGLTIKKALGSWGTCTHTPSSHPYFLAPGASCGTFTAGPTFVIPGSTSGEHIIGSAYVCG